MPKSPPPLSNNRTINPDLFAPTPPTEIPITRQDSLPARQQERKPYYPAKTYRIDPDIAARLKAWAALHKRTEQAIVEELIGDFLARVGG